MEKYLIAHKVRGEPAFDIAGKMVVGEEEWWIIPTSGHRAYPYWAHKLEHIMGGDWQGNDMQYVIENFVPSIPEHYEVSAAPKGKGSKTNGRDLLVQLGLAQPVEPLKRRSW